MVIITGLAAGQATAGETGVGELRRGAQLAGTERGRRASNAAKVGFDRIEAFGQRHGSRETRALDAEAELSATPPEYWN